MKRQSCFDRWMHWGLLDLCLRFDLPFSYGSARRSFYAGESLPVINELLRRLDRRLINSQPRPELTGVRRFAMEFWYFGVKEARACLFVGLFFAAVFTMPRAGLLGNPRYDALLLIALVIQAWMVIAKLETLDELKAISLFHLIGLGLEIFKTSGSIRSWSYPDEGWFKVFGVPLFSGLMYASGNRGYSGA